MLCHTARFKVRQLWSSQQYVQCTSQCNSIWTILPVEKLRRDKFACQEHVGRGRDGVSRIGWDTDTGGRQLIVVNAAEDGCFISLDVQPCNIIQLTGQHEVVMVSCHRLWIITFCISATVYVDCG